VNVPEIDCTAAGVDCAEVLARVWVYLDGEIDAAAREGLRAHLEECGPCLRHYGLEREVKALVARCCGSDRAPETLRSRVLASIRTEVTVGPDHTTVTVTESVTRSVSRD